MKKFYRFIIAVFAFFFSVSLPGCSEDIVENGSQDSSYDHYFNYSANIYAIIPGLGECNGKSFQGFAVFNDVAFCFYDTGICRTVDLNKKTIISQFNLPKDAFHKRNHAGVACFSEEYYENGDEFPLLYLSSYQENKCYVLRVKRDESELIQTIFTYEKVSDGKGDKLVPVLAYEPDGPLLLLKLRDSTYHWVTVDRPDVHQKQTVYLDYRDKLGEYEVFSSSAYNAGFALHGKIYQLAGYNRDEYKLYILDYVNKKILVDEYWNDALLTTYEQEQCSKFRNGILINYNRADQLVYVEFMNWDF